MKIVSGLAAVVVVLGMAAGAEAASFDCGRARAADERAICASRTLNDRDVTLAVTYRLTAHLMAMGGRGDLQDGQRAWLADRHRCGANAACLNRSYDARLSAVQAAYDGIVSRGPF